MGVLPGDVAGVLKEKGQNRANPQSQKKPAAELSGINRRQQ
jgi:hypothetical protein